MRVTRLVASIVGCLLVFGIPGFSFSQGPTQGSASPHLPVSASPTPEYLWYETENMRGISADTRHEPVVNPSWMQHPAAKKPGWGINGPGVSAEWSQGGESEWNSVNASADETRGTIWQDVEVPRAGELQTLGPLCRLGEQG